MGLFLSVYLIFSLGAFAAAPVTEPVLEPTAQLKAEIKAGNPPAVILSDVCESDMKPFLGKSDLTVLKSACSKVSQLDGCKSVQGHPIYHFDKKGDHKSQQKILVISLIHGDEAPAGSVGRFWMERLESIIPRNTWRVIPLLNPDGLAQKTRVNFNKIDLNRNFPTKDWEKDAVNYWKNQSKSNPRRFPGDRGGSEPETQCALKHIDDFKPDFIVSIHTPLKVLDYDGPKVSPPKYEYLPWKNLGHFPGSLGRYMWFERKVPVLTMELKEDLPTSTQPLIQLQDIIGFLVALDLNPKASVKASVK
jgi:hypothetical protein